MSVVWTVREAHPTLVEDGGGTLVNVTSRSVQEVIDDLVLSNSVRRGVIGLMKTLSREFAPEVRVNAVLPGAHETSRIEELVEDAVERGDYEDYQAGLEDWSEGIPLERVGDPRELGETVAWLSSERASYVNGAAVPVDGGSTRSV
jgi:NAD(P)-dependent dehydrogenase (short-subunit alcohol dehydrogenase family)